MKHATTATRPIVGPNRCFMPDARGVRASSDACAADAEFLGLSGDSRKARNCKTPRKKR